MKNLFCFAIILAVGLTGCKDKKKEEAAPKDPVKAPVMAPAKKVLPKKDVKKVVKVAPKKVELAGPGFKKIPNINGLVADVPAVAVPNGIGGAAGFHSKDNSFSFTLREIKGAAQKETFKKAKKDIKAMFFKKMIKAKKTKDGWVFIYHMKNPNEKTSKKIPVIFSFEIKRTIEGKVYKCYGGIEVEKGMDDVIKACNSIKKG
ncbi:hypothetical protein KKF84_17210 [Myxococcota bacterium]|nr:hypothetical protein [Myxococcota bacterium]MBU1537067.1 hypothetical protein [Myxococcota bacterium]